MKSQIPYWCIGLLLPLVILGQANGKKPEWYIYRLDKDGRYLELAPTHMNTSGGTHKWQDRQTQSGERRLEWTHGDLKTVFKDLHASENWHTRHVNLGPGRIVVETKNLHHYSVVYDKRDKSAIKDIATQLGLEVVIQKKEVPACTLESSSGPIPPTLEPYHGKPKWPHLKECSASANEEVEEIDKGLYKGSIYQRGDLYYFDGITFEEFARFLEEVTHMLVINKTGRKGRYSFTLPKDFRRHIVLPDSPQLLESIGVKVSRTDQENLKVVVVRDRKAGPTGELPMQGVVIASPPGHSDQIPELSGTWQIETITCFGQQVSKQVPLHRLRYDGQGFRMIANANCDAKEQERLDAWDDLVSWRITRWNKFYRATRFELHFGEWKAQNRVLLRLEGDTLHWCSVEAIPPQLGDNSPEDFSREQLAESTYMVLKRVNDGSNGETTPNANGTCDP